MSNSIRAGKAFLRLAEHDAGAKAFLTRLEAAGRKALPMVRKLAAKATSDDEAWQEAFGEPWPQDVADWKRWAGFLELDANWIVAGEWSPCDILEIVEGRLLQRKEKREQAEAGPEYLGNGRLRIANETISLEGNQEAVLEALLNRGGAATISELRSDTLVDDVPRVLKRIRTHPGLEEYIVLPGGRGKGGYRTTISDGR